MAVLHPDADSADDVWVEAKRSEQIRCCVGTHICHHPVHLVARLPGLFGNILLQLQQGNEIPGTYEA